MGLLLEIAGWAGAASILSAYLSASRGWIRTGRLFYAVNLLGSCAFIINGAYHGAWPSVVTNIAWFLISLIALLHALRRRAEPKLSVRGRPPTAATPAPSVDYQNRKETHVIP